MDFFKNYVEQLKSQQNRMKNKKKCSESGNRTASTMTLCRCIVLNLILCVSLTGCMGEKKAESNAVSLAGEQQNEEPYSTENQETTVTGRATQADRLKGVKEVNVDYSGEFNGLNGCAVIYDESEEIVYFYNKAMGKEEVSPYSSFKIISALIGLDCGILADENSHMEYNGTQYPLPEWNQELTLKAAFRNSCIWYFYQVIQEAGRERVSEELKKVQYGNCDISEWYGSGINSSPDLNGFWLGSSLKISPYEQVEVLSGIMEGKYDFAQENVNILKSLMFIQSGDAGDFYGKTGAGTDGQAWFVGFVEKDEQRKYFAVYLDDSNHKMQINGNVAKEIAVKITD